MSLFAEQSLSVSCISLRKVLGDMTIDLQHANDVEGTRK